MGSFVPTSAVLWLLGASCADNSAVITPRYMAGSRSGRFAEALADDRRDAVSAHGHAVERVADLHRALLVGDHEQLALCAELLVDLEQAAQVGVVERGLDLVEDVERRRPSLEQRDEEGDRDQRPPAAGGRGGPVAFFP